MTDRLPPLPLTDPSGRIFAYACAHCLEVGSIPGIGGGTLDSNREARAKASLRDAACCGECGDCKAFDADHVSGEGHVPCEACEGNGDVAAFIDGVKVRVQRPECEGDGRVWQPA